MAKSPHMSRSQFVSVTVAFMGSVIGAVIGLPAIGYLLSPALKAPKRDAWIPLGPLDGFPVGTPTLVSFTRSKVNGWEKSVNSYGVFVLRKTETETLVISNRCTHLSCRVNWDAAASAYLCPCHDAKFGAGGEVISGPPPRA